MVYIFFCMWLYAHILSHSQNIQTFKSKEVFSTSTSNESVHEEFQYKTNKSIKSRFKATCYHENYTWHCCATYVYWLFPCSKLVVQHTCSSIQLNPYHHHTNKKVFGHLFFEVMCNNHRRIYRGSDIIMYLI